MIKQAREQEQLFGHELAALDFIRAKDAGRFAHAWLISGAAGIGKATFAYHAARWVLAGSPSNDTIRLPEGHPFYRQITNNACPGLLVIDPVLNEKSGTYFDISVTQVRGGKDARTGVDKHFKGIYEFLRHTAADNGWRVVLIDGVDMLTPQAQNALLKILEEPPANALLLLTTSHPGRLLPTIRSRCRSLPLKPLPMAELQVAAEKSGLKLPDKPMELLAAAEGSVGEVARLLNLDAPSLLTLISALVENLPSVDWSQVQSLGALVSRKENEARFNLALELLLQSIARRLTAQPQFSPVWDNIMLKINAIHGLHLDKTASLVEIFSILQKYMSARSISA